MNNITDKEDITKFWVKHNRFKELKSDKTMVEICEELDLDQGNLSKMLNGQVNVYLFRLVQLAESLGCKPSELLPLEWQHREAANKDDIYKNIYEVTRAVEKHLLLRKKILSPEDKAELIAGLSERVSELPEDKKQAKIIEITDFILDMKRTG